MFDQLSDKFSQAFKKLRGKGKLSEKDIDETLREIRLFLLEADVNYKVVKGFISSLKEKCMGSEVLESLTPAQSIIKIVNEELTLLLGGTKRDINFVSNDITVVMVVGVQGSGKTTSIGKMANYFKNKGKKVVLAACDTHRMAAVDQLKILGEKAGIDVFYEDISPEKIAKKALKFAKDKGADLLIVDTAGRQHVDDEMMKEAVKIKEAVNPNEILFVIDAMMGQQALDAANAFNENLDVSGFILSKLDSDARGGSALSVSYVTGKPIKYSGTGEKMEDFEPFHPDRVSSRILGLGDMLTLIEKAQTTFDEEKALKMQKKLQKNDFTLDDFLDQIEQLNNMGGISSILSMLPGAAGKQLKGMNFDEKQLVKQKAIIQSMTLKERQNPSIINANRRRRIANGSATKVSDVNKLLNGFEQSRKLLKQVGKGKNLKNMKFPFM